MAALVAGGVRHAFTVPGESFLGVLDALHDAPIRTIATRHEGGAAFMAEAVGQLTGRPAACLATRAVGAANLAIGLHTARADSAPLIALIGQVPRAFRGREAFQEVDQVETFGRLCKSAAEVDEPALAGRRDRHACSRSPGPAVPDPSCWPCPRTCSTSASPLLPRGMLRPRPTSPTDPSRRPAAVRAVLAELAGAKAAPDRRRRGSPAQRRRGELQAFAKAAVPSGDRQPGGAPTASITNIRSISA